MAKTKDVLRLSDGILGAGMYDKLVLRNTQISALLKDVKTRFDEIKNDYTKNRALLLFMNGRVDKVAWELADQVLEKTKKELTTLYFEMRDLGKLRDDIEGVLKSIDNSRKSEEKVLKLEKFLNRQDQEQSMFTSSKLPYLEELSRVKEQARLLDHSASALLQLKIGL